MAIFGRRTLPWPLTLLIGIGILAAGCYLGSTVFHVVYHGTKAAAAVVDMRGKQEKTGRHSRGTRYHAVLAFTDSQNRRVEFEDEKGFSSATQYRKGQSLPVLYLPADPVHTAVVDRGWELWWTTGICGIAGIALIGSALLRAAGYDSTF
ncbi:MAG: DUF3592 domain-containing protein [Alphaproteobacteria bacterium]|nr:MAG: DUF3592 domain-containing protein [Alphaproteobacteria bacterium]